MFFSKKPACHKEKDVKPKPKVTSKFIFCFWQTLNGIRSGYLVSKEKYLEEKKSTKCPIYRLFQPVTKDTIPKSLTYPHVSKELLVIPDEDTYF